MKCRKSQQGVALVVTLILLSVITFMAVTFLVVSRREGERVVTQSNQSNAKFAADAALEQAKGSIIAPMLARNNGYNFGLQVSTNYNSSAGYFTGIKSITNVSYTYPNSTNLLVGNDMLLLLNNLQILPRAPVFVTTNKLFPPDFRYYLDLNRNGVYDTNGFGTNYYNGQFQFDPVTGNPMTNTFVGDPEWVGVLEKPELPHSSSNRFIARYAFIAQPIGNSLDINHIHNQAKQFSKINQDGFLRDHGFGSWEINLAGFLYYLNTNQWGGPYKYSTAVGNSRTGVAFTDAVGIVRYRYNLDWHNLAHFNQLYVNSATKLFGGPQDLLDGYAHGPVMTGIYLPPTLVTVPIDPDQILTVSSWPGADNPRHFFSSQDLFSSEPFNGQFQQFSNHLFIAGTNLLNSYDRYTFYKLIEQMGPESAPEDLSKKINLNYGNSGATNFTNWTPNAFFTNAADKLLKNLAAGDTTFPHFPYPTNFGIANIPIYPTNYYTPAVHRMLQLAANIYDASNTNYFPSVFRPIFTSVPGSNSIPIISISGYVEEPSGTVAYLSTPLSLPEQASLVGPTTTNIYGFPWVIGVKKGFPNFNEFSLQNVSQITRKLQLDKGKPAKPRAQWQTNQLYVIGISNIVGVEAWNSYSNNFTRTVEIITADDMNLFLTVSNDVGGVVTKSLSQIVPGAITTNIWTGFKNTKNPGYDVLSFQVPIHATTLFVPDSVFYQNPPRLTPTLGISNDLFEVTTDFRVPHFVLTMTNRLRFIMRDHDTGRIFDYVTFKDTDGRDLTAKLPEQDSLGIWDPTVGTVGGTKPPVTAAPNGVINQILDSLTISRTSLADWNNAQLKSSSLDGKSNEITGFAAFYNNAPSVTVTALQVPFTPTKKFSDTRTWQANDPLVHYTLGDLASVPHTNDFEVIVPPNSPPSFTNGILANLGRVNDRYKPWSGNPSKADPDTDYHLELKDPLVSQSDDWNFPTNKFPNIGWLGRVHRGTPWQTVYLKSAPAALAAWQTWSGNPDTNNATLTQPTNDWTIFDLFTVAPNENASRGQLSVNQTNTAAWAAILQGVVTLTNTTSDSVLQNSFPIPQPTLDPLVIDPITNNAAFLRLVSAINDVRRTNQLHGPASGGVFQHLGEILAVPELTVNSPFLNVSSGMQLKRGLNDAAYERIPQQIFSLLKVGEPRYVIYSYGQSLKPADHSIVQKGGLYFGMCTNYQITGEVATRTVLRIVNPPVPGTTITPATPKPQVIVESFNVLPPE